MSETYRNISTNLARQIRLIMTDVDGTIASGGEPASKAIAETVRRLEDAHICVGLVSGRTLPELEQMAIDLHISGPVIAENGGIAKLNARSQPMELGYSRQLALEALKTLRRLFPASIREREDNAVRLIDIVIWADGVSPEELRRHIGSTQLVDSGYIMHLMQAGISKGNTLANILPTLPLKGLTAEHIMVFGDSLTDHSLFEHFPYGVLIPNPLVRADHRCLLEKTATFITAQEGENGFIEAANLLLKMRGLDSAK